MRIKVIPVLTLVKDGKTKDYVIGFIDLGNTDDCTTETLERRLGFSDILNYSGNLVEPPCQSQKEIWNKLHKAGKENYLGKEVSFGL